MTIEYTQLTSCADIDQSKFVDGNYYLLAWGMGDAILSLIHI